MSEAETGLWRRRATTASSMSSATRSRVASGAGTWEPAVKTRVQARERAIMLLSRTGEHNPHDNVVR